MNVSSPLRYPGGKSAMSGLLGQIRKLNRLGDRFVAEPFAGGAGAALSLLFLEETTDVYINDLDPAIFDFWWTLLNRPTPFLQLMRATRVNMAEWRRQRAIYRSRRQQSHLRRGFAAFYLNRCNRSGIIANGGPIGGPRQQGKWKLNARFNKSDLLRRCQKIAEYSHRIHASCRDGIEFIDSLDLQKGFLFIDPPYYAKGNTLYLNALDHKYHAALASRLRSMTDSPWVLTYDDCPEIRDLYNGWTTVREFSLQYSASDRRHGREVLIAPKWMRLPAFQTSEAINW
jgi:DNA adenine methylase